MKNRICLLSLAILIGMTTGLFANKTSSDHQLLAGGEYKLVVEGYDWGPAVSKVILTLDEPVTAVDRNSFKVLVERSTDCVDIPAEQALGSRMITYAYVSDEKGSKVMEGKYITLVLMVAPNDPLGSPIQYTRNKKCSGNNWIDYKMTIRNESEKKEWNKANGRISPLLDRFDLSGRFKASEDLTLSYASYQPNTDNDKSPLIIWLHGGGEGGTDPSIPLVANRAANYASDEIQVIFEGAYVLSPQSPTRWMDDGKGSSTRGQKDDMYNEALMRLIQEYVSANPGIDQDRIYVGGCSNGGYMALKLILLHPDYFAAGYISALAYGAQYISDEQIELIKNVPIWFIQSKDDPVTVPATTVIPVYNRLIAAGAPDVHFSFYDHVVDITRFFGGDDYHYNGHWSWIYSHSNHAKLDFDGKPVTINGSPVTIMEWMAAQSR